MSNSQPKKHWCKFCRKWIQGHPSTIRHHESHNSHKMAVQRYLKSMHREQRDRERADAKGRELMASLERQADAKMGSFRQGGTLLWQEQAQAAVPSLRPRQRKVEKKVDEEASISVDTCGRVFLDAKAYNHLLFPGIQLDVRMDASWMPCVFVRKVLQGAGSACIVKYQGKDCDGASMRTVDLETIRIPVAPPPPPVHDKNRASVADAKLIVEKKSVSTGLGRWETVSQGADHGMGFQQANVEEGGDGTGGGEVLPRDGYPSIEAQTFHEFRCAGRGDDARVQQSLSGAHPRRRRASHCRSATVDAEADRHGASSRFN